MIFMKESMLSLKEKTTQHFSIVFCTISGYRIEFSCLYIPQWYYFI